MQLLKQSTAATVVVGPVLDADGAAVTTATVTNFSIAKNGTVAALTSETVTHSANGYYTIALTATNTNTLGRLDIIVNASTMSMANHRYDVLVAATYDAIVTNGIATSAQATAIEADTLDIQSRIPSTLDLDGNMRSSVQNIGAVADGVWDEPYAGHTTAGTFGKLMDILRKANLWFDGTVSNAITPTTLTFSSNVAATTSAYAHAVLLFVSGPLTGENSPIISYNSTNGVFVLEEALTAVPSNGDEFVVIAGSHVHAIADIQSGLATSTGVTAAFTEIKGAGWSSATDTLEEIADAAGSGGVTVAPLQASAPDQVVGTEIIAYINDTSSIGPIAITDSDGTAVDLSSYTLKVCIERDSDGTILQNVSPSLSGVSNNQITFTPNAASVATTKPASWSLRSTADGKVFARGPFTVQKTARIL
jgi:PKD repeat protein